MASDSKTQMFRSFRHRNFRLFFGAALISNVGFWVQMIAQDWLVLELTSSAFALSVVTFLQLLPALALSLPAGQLADKYDKRRILIITNSIGCLTAGTLGFLVITDRVELWHVMALAFTLGCAGSVENPVRMALNAELVGRDDLPNAVSLNSTNFNIARLIGPALSGLLIAAFGTGPSFIINSVSYLFVIAALIAMRTADLHIEPKTEVKGTIREGWRYIAARDDLKAVLLIAFFASTFGLNFNFFNAMMVTEVFKLNAATFGSLGTVVAIGSLSGALLSARLERLRTPGNVLRGAAAFGAVIVLMSLAPSFAMYALLLPLGGISALLTLIAANSCMQTHTDPAVRGRVVAWYILAFNAPFGQPFLGALADQIGVRGAIGVAGSITAVSAVLIALRFRGRLGRPKDFGMDAVMDSGGRL